MLIKILYRVLIALALLFTVILAVLGLFVHMEVDFASMTEGLTNKLTSPATTIPLALILTTINVIVTTLFYRNATNKKCRRFNISVLCAVIICIVLGVSWLMGNSYDPVGDQKHVWETASLILQNRGKEVNLSYYKTYSQQKIICLMMMLFIKIFQNNGLLAYRIFCLICASLIIFLGGKQAYHLSGREEAGTASAIMLVEFIPIVLYSTYVYGTLPSLCFTLLAFYAVTRLIQTQRLYWLVVELVAIPLMYAFYTATMIAMIAIMVVLILYAVVSFQKRNSRVAIAALFGAVLPFFLVCGIRVAAGNIFCQYTGLNPNEDTLPATAWIRMGLTSDSDLGPGGYDASNVGLFQDKGSDTEKTDAAARKEIHSALEDYRNGSRPMTFFWKKTETQWLDPWFNGLTMTVYSPDPEKMGILAPLFVPLTLERIQRCLLALMNVCYCMASLYLILQIRNKKPRLETLLLPLYFVGGFVFQLFWETKGRYCFPYYVCLLILAGIATASLEQFLVRRYEAMRDRKKLKERASAQLSKKTK